MRLMSEWILKAEELLQEGYVLLEKDKVWTRREKDDDWIMMENDNAGLSSHIASPHINIQKNPHARQ